MKNGRLIPSETWAERISRSGYSRQNVNCLVKILMEKEIPLLKQPEDYQGPFKVSYYYPESPSIASDFATIQELADERRFVLCLPAVTRRLAIPLAVMTLNLSPSVVARIRLCLF